MDVMGTSNSGCERSWRSKCCTSWLFLVSQFPLCSFPSPDTFLSPLPPPLNIVRKQTKLLLLKTKFLWNLKKKSVLFYFSWIRFITSYIIGWNFLINSLSKICSKFRLLNFWLVHLGKKFHDWRDIVSSFEQDTLFIKNVTPKFF